MVLIGLETAASISVPTPRSARLIEQTPGRPGEPLVSYRFELLRGLLGMVAARLIEGVVLEAWRAKNGEIREETPVYWERVADRQADPETAVACRERAEFLRMYPELVWSAEDEVANVVGRALGELGVDVPEGVAA